MRVLYASFMSAENPKRGRVFLVGMMLIILVGLFSALLESGPRGDYAFFEIAWSWATKLIGLAFAIWALWCMSGSIGEESTVGALLPGMVVLLGATLLIGSPWGSSVALGLIGSAWLLGNRQKGRAD